MDSVVLSGEFLRRMEAGVWMLLWSTAVPREVMAVAVLRLICLLILWECSVQWMQVMWVLACTRLNLLVTGIQSCCG